jgi:hypothetical protein
MRKLLLLIRDIVYLLLGLFWVATFFINRQAALDIMPLLVVVLFIGIDSRIGEIVARLKELSK